MKKVLVTASRGSGFFGSILKNRLLTEGFRVVNLDLVADPDQHAQLKSVRGDIRDASLVNTLFDEEKFDAVMHCAAKLAHEKIGRQRTLDLATSTAPARWPKPRAAPASRLSGLYLD